MKFSIVGSLFGAVLIIISIIFWETISAQSTALADNSEGKTVWRCHRIFLPYLVCCPYIPVIGGGAVKISGNAAFSRNFDYDTVIVLP